MSPEVPLGPAEGYSFLPHSSSSVGQGEAELKPGTGSSDLSLEGSGYVVAQKMVIALGGSRSSPIFYSTRTDALGTLGIFTRFTCWSLFISTHTGEHGIIYAVHQEIPNLASNLQ